MTKDELLDMLRQPEWNNLEVKKASDTSKSAYDTVSAFANTGGGWIIFGVAEVSGPQRYDIQGVHDVDKVQNEFLNEVRKLQKFSCVVKVNEYMIEVEGKFVLAFYVHEAAIHDKPVQVLDKYHNWVAFVRRGARDDRCNLDELDHFRRDASTITYDTRPVDVALDRCFNQSSIDWYRKTYYNRQSSPDPSASDIDFLRHLGLIIEKDEQLKATLASVLLFGTDEIINQMLPRPVIEAQWLKVGFNDPLPEERWADRLMLETNLIEAWKRLSTNYVERSSNSFAIDPVTMRRVETPTDYLAFREAAVNVLVHQDYGDLNRKASIKFYTDRTVLFNPGCAKGQPKELLEAGEKYYRNPRLVFAFRRIGLSEQAGTGIQTIYSQWRGFGFVPPVFENRKEDNSFTLSLLKEILLSEDQKLFQVSFGLSLSEQEAAVVALAHRQERLTLFDVKAVTGYAAPDCIKLLERLKTQTIFKLVDIRPESHYVLEDRFKPQPAPVTMTGELVMGKPLTSLTNHQWRILRFCDTPRSAIEIKTEIGFKSSLTEDFWKIHIKELLEGNLLKLHITDKDARLLESGKLQPEKPSLDPKRYNTRQKYVITEAAAPLIAQHFAGTDNTVNPD
jgi:ATP-dependent DNA helicase RecG